jgi:hypothetical protein
MPDAGLLFTSPVCRAMDVVATALQRRDRLQQVPLAFCS